MSTDPVYSHLKATWTKALSNNKLTDYAIITRSTMIDEYIRPHDAMRLNLSKDGLMIYKNIVKLLRIVKYTTCLQR